MNVKTMTNDQILQTLAWIVDRQRYRRDCKKENGASYAEECNLESRCMAELQTRGFEWRYAN